MSRPSLRSFELLACAIALFSTGWQCGTRFQNRFVEAARAREKTCHEEFWQMDNKFEEVARIHIAHMRRFHPDSGDRR